MGQQHSIPKGGELNRFFAPPISTLQLFDWVQRWLVTVKRPILHLLSHSHDGPCSFSVKRIFLQLCHKYTIFGYASNVSFLDWSTYRWQRRMSPSLCLEIQSAFCVPVEELCYLRQLRWRNWITVLVCTLCVCLSVSLSICVQNSALKVTKKAKTS